MYFQAIVNSFSGLGPFCFHFNKDEQHTVLTLKQKLEQATAVGVNQQRLRSMAGKLLTDSDLLFADQINVEPVILNMTVRLIGGRNNQEDNSNNNNSNSNNESSSFPTYTPSYSSQLSLADQPLKKYKMNCDQHTLATFNNFYYKEKTKIEKQGLKSRRSEEEEKDLLIGEKGKQKETRKRKNFAA